MQRKLSLETDKTLRKSCSDPIASLMGMTLPYRKTLDLLSKGYQEKQMNVVILNKSEKVQQNVNISSREEIQVKPGKQLLVLGWKDEMLSAILLLGVTSLSHSLIYSRSFPQQTYVLCICSISLNTVASPPTNTTWNNKTSKRGQWLGPCSAG